MVRARCSRRRRSSHASLAASQTLSIEAFAHASAVAGNPRSCLDSCGFARDTRLRVSLRARPRNARVRVLSMRLRNAPEPLTTCQSMTRARVTRSNFSWDNSSHFRCENVLASPATPRHRCESGDSRGMIRDRLIGRVASSALRSPPAGWPCRRSPSSPGPRTSQACRASSSPVRPCRDWRRRPPRPRRRSRPRPSPA